jgi:hypothetical protein
MAEAAEPVTNLQVAVRCRPFSTKEKSNGEVSCVRITDSHITLTNPTNSADEHNFAFDVVIDDNWAQEIGHVLHGRVKEMNVEATAEEVKVARVTVKASVK